MKYSAYPSYKDSGVEWLGDVPSEWNVVRNKQVFSFIKQLVGKKSEDYPLLSLTLQGIKVRAVESGKGKFPAEFDTYQSVVEDDMVFCLFDIDETPRTVGISTYRGMITGAYNVVRCNAGIVPRFMYYYYLSVDEYKGLRPFYTGLRKVVRADTFMNIQLSIPSYQEQQAIVNFLDKATARINILLEKQTKLIELLKEKRQAVVSTIVVSGLNGDVPIQDIGIEWIEGIPKHWKLSRLRFVFSFCTGLSITKANLIDEGGTPCVNYGEIHSKFGFEVDVNKHQLKCVDNSYLSNSKSSLLSMGDFVFADTSEDIKGSGNFTYISGEKKIFAGYHTIVARQTTKQNSRFLAYLIDSEVFRRQIRLAVKGVKVFSITQAILKDAKVWLPDIGEQKSIVNLLDKKTQRIDSLITKATQSIVLLKEKRTTLISSAVTGRIDVREVA